MRKQRAFATLTDPEVEQISAWMDHETFTKVHQRIIKPRPEGFGLKCSKRPLETLYAKKNAVRLLNKQLPDEKKLTVTTFAALERGDCPTIDPEVHRAIMNTTRDLATSGEIRTPTQLLGLQRLADFPARAELRARRETRSSELHTHKIEMDLHRKHIATERLTLAQRSFALHEKHLALTLSSHTHAALGGAPVPGAVDGVSPSTSVPLSALGGEGQGEVASSTLANPSPAPELPLNIRVAHERCEKGCPVPGDLQTLAADPIWSSHPALLKLKVRLESGEKWPFHDTPQYAGFFSNRDPNPTSLAAAATPPAPLGGAPVPGAVLGVPAGHTSPIHPSSPSCLKTPGDKSKSLESRVNAYTLERHREAADAIAKHNANIKTNGYRSKFWTYTSNLKHCPCGSKLPCPQHGDFSELFWKLTPDHADYLATYRAKGLPFTSPHLLLAAEKQRADLIASGQQPATPEQTADHTRRRASAYIPRRPCDPEPDRSWIDECPCGLKLPCYHHPELAGELRYANPNHPSYAAALAQHNIPFQLADPGSAPPHSTPATQNTNSSTPTAQRPDENTHKHR